MEAMTPDEAKEKATAREGSTTVLAGGITLIAALLGAFGGLTGAVARMARNHIIMTPIVLGAVLLAVTLAVLVALSIGGIDALAP